MSEFNPRSVAYPLKKDEFTNLDKKTKKKLIKLMARISEASTAFEDWKSAMKKMLEWKKKRSPATVQRLEDERLAQVQASATIARGGV